ncbi:MAG: phosphatase PAP2 family protein [Armatimonadota bacterium]|nr:phosphatase PAP2 family protein [bacterium]
MFGINLGGIDAAVFHYINSELASPVMDRLMLIATMLGLGITQAGLCLAFIMLGWWANKENLRRAGYAGLTALAFSGVAVQIAKHLWDRPRPLLSMFDVRVVNETLFAHSFPSGHTTTAFAVIVACCIFLPKLRWLLIPLAFATGLSRVYLGVHFPLDVAYGALIGSLVGVASAALVGNETEERNAPAANPAG